MININDCFAFEEDIRKYLQSNLDLQKELGKNFIKPVFTTESEKPCITYTVSLINGGLLKQSKFDLKVICKNYDKAKRIECILNNILNQYEGDSFIRFERIYFHSQIAGGGTIRNRDFDLYELNLIFIIKWRCI